MGLTMKLIKPTRDEKLVIQILIAASFGLIIGVWAMLERVNEAESERDLLMLHVEELVNTHSIRNRVDRVTQPNNED
tara:strand:+ start:231 stop:461 length:231 start_codon:yes stop_codon:yes gene_type:complete